MLDRFLLKTLTVIADPSNDPNGEPTYVADSFKIALYLDDKYPSPQYPLLFPSGTRTIQHLLMTQYYPLVGASISSLFHPSVPRILDHRSAEYMRRTRGERMIPLSEEAAAEKWKEVREKLEVLGKSLQLNDGTKEAGPFIMGDRVAFMDFALGGVFYWIKNLEGSDSPRLKEMLEWQDGRWETLWKRIQEIEMNSSQVE